MEILNSCSKASLDDPEIVDSASTHIDDIIPSSGKSFGSSTCTTSGITGNMRFYLRDACEPRRASDIRCV